MRHQDHFSTFNLIATAWNPGMLLWHLKILVNFFKCTNWRSLLGQIPVLVVIFKVVLALLAAILELTMQFILVNCASSLIWARERVRLHHLYLCLDVLLSVVSDLIIKEYTTSQGWSIDMISQPWWIYIIINRTDMSDKVLRDVIIFILIVM
jgi:hypothetical protein